MTRRRGLDGARCALMRRGFMRDCGWVSDGCWRQHASQLDPGDVREIFCEVGVALRGDLVLLRLLAVLRVDLVDHVHAFDDFSEGCEAHAVEAGVVSEVDEELGGARVGAGGGEDQAAARVALLDGVVLNIGLVPRLVDGGIGAESELHDEAGHDTEEAGVGEEAVADEVVEAVRAEGRPVAMHLNDEDTGSGGEADLIEGRRFRFERGGIEQRWASCGRVPGGRALGMRRLGR